MRKAFGRHLELPVLVELGGALLVALWVNALLRFEDYFHRDMLGQIIKPSYEAYFLWLELTLAFVIPITMLSFKKVRLSPNGLYLASIISLLGFITNRLNVSLTGFETYVGHHYIPKWTEFSVTLMIIAHGLRPVRVGSEVPADLPRRRTRSGEASPNRNRACGRYSGIRPCRRLTPIRGDRGWNRLTNSISAKLIGSLLAVMVVIFALLGYLNIRLHRQHLEAATLASAERVSDVIKRSTTYYMLRNDREGLYHAIQTMADEPGMIKVRIFDQEGRISYSTDPAEVSHVLDKTAEACYGCHTQSQPLARLNRPDRFRIYRNGGGQRVLGIITPIENQPSCSNADCHAHPASQQVLGVLDTNLSLAKTDVATCGQQRSHAVLHRRSNADCGGAELVVRVASGRRSHQSAQERHGTSFRWGTRLPDRGAIPRRSG